MTSKKKKKKERKEKRKEKNCFLLISYFSLPFSILKVIPFKSAKISQWKMCLPPTCYTTATMHSCPSSNKPPCPTFCNWTVAKITKSHRRWVHVSLLVGIYNPGCKFDGIKNHYLCYFIQLFATESSKTGVFLANFLPKISPLIKVSLKNVNAPGAFIRKNTV